MKYRVYHFISYSIFISFFTILISACSSSKKITPPYTKEEIVAAINSDNWTASVHYATPQYGRSRNVTGIYHVTCKKDTITFYLPYFGRSYSAMAPASKNPLDFMSTDFSLTKEQKKDGAWEITMKTKDNAEIQNCIFDLYDNGSSRISITFVNRSSIYFTGTVSPVK